jgi:DNA-binding IclR family transcriptional regulator
VHVGITLGSVHGPFDGAVGKCLLAALGPDAAEECVAAAGDLAQHTPKTLTEPRRLLADVARIRERGWASSVGELNENNAVAVPIVGPSGPAELVLLALGFASQLPPDAIPELGVRMRAVARAVTESAGGRELFHDAATPPNGPQRAQEKTHA